jgi:predicted transcriptional regulator
MEEQKAPIHTEGGSSRKKAQTPVVPSAILNKKTIDELGETLYQLRGEAGLTQADVAQKMDTQQGFVSGIESTVRQKKPRIDTLIKYLHIIGYEIALVKVKEVRKKDE